MALVIGRPSRKIQSQKRDKRGKQLRLAVDVGVKRWQTIRRPHFSPQYETGEENIILKPTTARPRLSGPGVMSSLPRREFITTEATDVAPPMMRSDTFPANRVKAILRIPVWIKAGLFFVLGITWDWMRGRDSPHQTAMRMRRIFERVGGTFINIGQYLAMRIDLLPWIFCVELSKLHNKMPPFPVDRAIKTIERCTGKPLAKTFRQFDPEPILSTSVSCIYQAFLLNGEKVVVKVRRPGIGESFMVDCIILDWILDSLEFLSILRPGLTQNMRRDFQASINDELNFLSEARFQELFRQAPKSSGRRVITSPRIHFELCSQDVIVEEFSSGLWLWELIAAVEQNDKEILETARNMGIDPKVVARRLLWTNFRDLDERLFFLVEPRPDNVIVGSDNKLTFIDFSSVGSINTESRQAIRQIMHYALKRDPLSMAQASLVLLEPLPPIDVVDFTKSLEERYWQYLYALESKHTAWWEHTSAHLWVGFVEVARTHGITINLEVLRMIRSSLLFDTLAARLFPKIDRIKVYDKFTRYRAKQSRKRVEKGLESLFQPGKDSRFFIQLEKVTDTSGRLFEQFQRIISTPVFKFNAIIGKSVFALSSVLGLLGHWVVFTAIAFGFAYVFGLITTGQLLIFREIAHQVFSNRIYQISVLILLLLNLRAILFRLGDKEI